MAGIGQEKVLDKKNRSEEMTISVGNKVKYIGTAIPRYTNKLVVVKNILVNGLILEYPKEDRRKVVVEGNGTWNMNSFICGFTEVEVTNDNENRSG